MNDPIPYRYVRGVLDGEEGLYYDTHLRTEVYHPLYCKRHKDGHLSYPHTNDYAVYRLVDPEEGIYLFYGVEHQVIDIRRGKDYIISRKWVSIDRSSPPEEVNHGTV